MNNENCVICHPIAKHSERKAIYERLVEESEYITDNDAAVIMRAICDMRYYCSKDMREDRNKTIYEKIKDKIDCNDFHTIVILAKGALIGILASSIVLTLIAFYTSSLYQPQ
jgi:hypothetical protein